MSEKEKFSREKKPIEGKEPTDIPPLFSSHSFPPFPYHFLSENLIGTKEEEELKFKMSFWVERFPFKFSRFQNENKQNWTALIFNVVKNNTRSNVSSLKLIFFLLSFSFCSLFDFSFPLFPDSLVPISYSPFHYTLLFKTRSKIHFKRSPRMIDWTGIIFQSTDIYGYYFITLPSS